MWPQLREQPHLPARATDERPLDPGQAAERDRCVSVCCSLGCDQPTQQRGNRCPLVCEEPDITLRAGPRQRPGRGVHRSLLLAAGGQR